MKSKLLLGIGVAAGYVLGARSGRAAYERIKTRATGFWESEPVQQKVAAATEALKEKAPEVADQLGEAARRAGTVIGQAMHRDSEDDEQTAAADAAVPGHSSHAGTTHLGSRISPDAGAKDPISYEAAESLDEVAEEHDRAADAAGAHARTADVDSDPALNDSTGQDWTDEGGATESGAATESGQR